MTKPVGGRGKKAPYETIQMRVPVPIKDRVNELINQFRDGALTGAEADISDSTAELENLKQQIQNLNTTLEISETEKQNLNTALQDANQRINNLNTALMSAQSEIQNLSTSFKANKDSEGKGILADFYRKWKEKSNSMSPTSTRWEWGRKILDDLETVLGVEKVEEKESDSAQLSLVE